MLGWGGWDSWGWGMVGWVVVGQGVVAQLGPSSGGVGSLGPEVLGPRGGWLFEAEWWDPGLFGTQGQQGGGTYNLKLLLAC